MPAAVVDQAEERQELRPAPIAVVHRVGMPPGVLAEPLEEADDRVVLLVDLVVREERTVLGVEDEHQPQQDAEQARIDLVRVVLQHVAEQLAVPLVVGRLEAAEQLIERGQHLLGQLGRDEVLVLPALGEDGRQALLVGEREEPLGGEQHLEGREDRPAGHLGHRLDRERQVARGLAARGVDEPQVRPVREQADRHLGLAQQPLEPGLRAGLPAMVLGVGLRRLIEVEAQLDPLDQHEPFAGVASCWLLVACRTPERRRTGGGSRCTRAARLPAIREPVRRPGSRASRPASQPRIWVAKRGNSRIAGWGRSRPPR